MHNEDEMKRRGDEPATKRDLWAHEAATKKNIQTHAEATKRGFQAASERMDRLEKVVKNVAVEIGGVKKDLSNMREDFSAALKRTESRLIDHIDGFMAKTVKVERDQSILIHRIDRIEERVTRIENRAS